MLFALDRCQEGTELSLMMMRLSVSVGEENYHGAFDDDDPIYEGKKQSSAICIGE